MHFVRRFLFFLLSLGLFAGGAYLAKPFIWKNFHEIFWLENAVISGNYRTEKNEIELVLEIGEGKWLWEISLGDIQKRILSLPWISRAEISWKRFPGRLEVKVFEEEPWLVANFGKESSHEQDFSKHNWIVARSGKLIQNLTVLNTSQLVIELAELPRLFGVRESASSRLGGELKRALQSIRYLEAASEMPFEVEHYRMLEAHGLEVAPVELYRFPKVRFLLSSFEEAETQMERLRAVLSDLEKRSEIPVLVDLRYQGRAIVEREE